MEKALTDSQVCDWVIRGEGGANVVMGYTGRHPSLMGKVLRIPKEYKRQVDDNRKLQILDGVLWSQELGMEGFDSKDKLSRAKKYAWSVLGAKLGHQFISTEAVIDVPEPLRLSHDLGHRGVIFDDATLFRRTEQENGSGAEPVISIEVKPKCGFIPPGPVEQAAARFPKFTLKQMLKLQQGKIASCSHYNPLKMFSGDKDMMLDAFEELLKNPQNNLKVFINGEYVAPCSQGYLNSHAETLLRIALEKMIGNLVDSVWRVLCSELISILLQEGILSRVLALQKLDSHGVDVAYSLYQQLLDCREDDLMRLAVADSLSSVESNQNQFANTHNDGDDDVSLELGPANSLATHNGYGMPGENDGMPALVSSRKSRDELLQDAKILKEYLMAATAKDCSIFVTFRSARVGVEGENTAHGFANKNGDGKTSPNVTHKRNGNANRSSGRVSVFPKTRRWGKGSILYKVAVADLDIKHVSKVVRHFNMNQTLNRIALSNETIPYSQ